MWSATARVGYQPSTIWANSIFQNVDRLTSKRVGFLRPFKEKDPKPGQKPPADPLKGVLLPSISFLSKVVNLLKDALVLYYSELEMNGQLRDPVSYATIQDIFYDEFDVIQQLPSSLWRQTPLLTNKSLVAQDPAKPNTAAPPVDETVAPSLAPSRKRPSPDQPSISGLFDGFQRGGRRRR